MSLVVKEEGPGMNGYQAQENEHLKQQVISYVKSLLAGETLENRPGFGIYEFEVVQLEKALQTSGKQAAASTLQSLITSSDNHPLGKLMSPEHFAKGGESEHTRYKPLSITDMLNLPEQDWLLANFLYEDAISIIYGVPGSAKSFLMVDWACHLALGLPWQGHATKRCRVLYLATEGIRGYRRRLLAWCSNSAIRPELLESRLAFIPHAVPLRQKTEVNELITCFQEYLQNFPDDGTPLIIVLDTLFGCAAGVNINAPDAATALIEAIQHIKEEVQANHILVVHHSGKDKERGMSGNMALKASTELSYHVELDKETKAMTITSDRIKDDEDIVTYLQLEKVIYGDGPRDNSCVILPGEKPAQAQIYTDTQQKMLAILAESPSGLRSTDWQQTAEERYSIAKRTFHDNLRKLKNSNTIENTGTESHPIYKIKTNSDETV